MKDEIIKFKTAKLAKEKGFNEKCNFIYSSSNYPYDIPIEKCIGEITIFKNFDLEQGIMPSDEGDILYFEYTASTQSSLQKWLREEHDIHMWVEYTKIIQRKDLFYRFHVGKSLLQHMFKSNFKSYEEALESGLLEGLKLINN